jgi:hypothetical protein
MRPIFAFVLMLACGALAAAQSAQNVAFKPYSPHRQLIGRVDNFSTFVLHNEADWERYWSTALANGVTDSQGNPLPAVASGVDWKTTELIAIHLGARRTSGFSAKVVSVTRVGHRYEVAVDEILPGGMVMQHFTYPYTIISVPAGVPDAHVTVIQKSGPMRMGMGHRNAVGGGG